MPSSDRLRSTSLRIHTSGRSARLRDAALLTLDIAASGSGSGLHPEGRVRPYNIQFWNGRPVLIDTLSFEEAVPGQPWVAYRQYCEHFSRPLALMALRDVRLGLLQRDFLDGLPLDLAGPPSGPPAAD